MAVTLSKYGSSINRLLCHLVGLSADTKPIGTYTDKSGKVFLLENGSSFEEMDTDKKYLYDAENQTWNLADSGGGGGSATLIEKSITENGEYNASADNADGYKKVTVDVAGGGSSTTSKKDVNFYDYDGTIVNSYTASEFAELSALPDNPTHDGLTAQGWNWSLADAKNYVASYGKLEIGQMYITDNGETRLYITLSEGRTSPVLKLQLNDNSELDIDWGDGSIHSTFTTDSEGYKSERHEYSIAGDYVIAITVVSGGFKLNSSEYSCSSILWNGTNSTTSPDIAYNNAIKKVEVGSGVTAIGMYAFNGCYSLSLITIPNNITSISEGAFQRCYSLSSITIPDEVTNINYYAFNSCYSLSLIALPSSLTEIGYAFSNCYSLSSITIPDSVTSIGNNICSGCPSLSSVVLSSGIRNINSSAFENCYSLSSITIPDSVTNIGGSAFAKCSYMSYIKFEPTTPPSVGSYAFRNLSTSTKILVPAGTLETYKAKTNYPDPSTYTYEEY